MADPPTRSPAAAGLRAGSGRSHLPSTAVMPLTARAGDRWAAAGPALAGGMAPCCLMAQSRQQLHGAAGYPQVNPSKGDGYLQPPETGACKEAGMEPGLPSPPPRRLPRMSRVKEPKVHLKGERFHPAAGEQSPEGDQQPPAESKPSPCLPLPQRGGHDSTHQPKPLCPTRSCSGAVVCSLPSSLALGVDRGNFKLKPPCNGHHWCPPSAAPGSPQTTCYVCYSSRRLQAGGARLPSPPPSTTRTRNTVCLVFVSGRMLSCCSCWDGKCIQFSTETKKIPHLCQICKTAWGKMGNKFSSFFFFLMLSEKAPFPGEEQSRALPQSTAVT